MSSASAASPLPDANPLRQPAAARLPTPEQALAVELVRRPSHPDRVAALVARVNLSRFAAELHRHRLFTLLGRRLIALEAAPLPAQFLAAVESGYLTACRRGAVMQMLTAEVLEALGAAGIPAVPLKGPFQALWLHGDLGLRLSADIDVLVPRQAMTYAISVLSELDWLPPNDPGGLPRLHHHLRRRGGGPILELHWRAHWYEGRFSSELAQRAVPDHGARRPRPADELVLLLAQYARDGLAGLRWLSDLEAWWRRCAARTARRDVEAVLDHHPPLRLAVTAAAATSERFLGLPVWQLVPPADRGARRRQMATALADWTAPADDPVSEARASVINLLLCPPDQMPRQTLREYAPPLPPGDGRPGLRRLAHAAHSAAESVGVLWELRHSGISMPPGAEPTIADLDAG